MTTKNILKDIETVTKLNKDYKRIANETLSHAANTIRSLEKKLEEEYERGTKDAWDLTRKITCYTTDGGMHSEQIETIFGYADPSYVMVRYSYEDAKKKMEEYLGKEEDPIVKGDVVFCIRRDNDCKFYEGIYLDKDSTDYYIFVKEDKSVHILMDDVWRLTKTDKHVDLDW